MIKITRTRCFCKKELLESGSNFICTNKKCKKKYGLYGSVALFQVVYEILKINKNIYVENKFLPEKGSSVYVGSKYLSIGTYLNLNKSLDEILVLL